MERVGLTCCCRWSGGTREPVDTADDGGLMDDTDPQLKGNQQ